MNSFKKVVLFLKVIISLVILKKKNFSGNSWRKYIKVTFASFDLHAQMFKAECIEYGSTLFSYFGIFICVSSNFTLDSRITEYLQCYIGLQGVRYEGRRPDNSNSQCIQPINDKLN